MKLFVAMLFLLIAGFASGQSGNFAAIDKYVLTVHETSPELLSKKLTSPYKTQKEKVRAIFKWITENIAYDVEGLRLPNVYADIRVADSIRFTQDYNKEYNRQIVNKVLAEKKAICDGYSRLFKTLCDYANINCEIVVGRGRQWYDVVPDATSNHSWNAVMINEQWHLLDATWGAGYTIDSSTKFLKVYKDFYFLTPPGAFINTHFPDDPKWTLLDEKPHLYQVYNTVYTYSEFYKAKVRSVTPVERMIRITPTNRKVVFELELPPGTIPKHVSFTEEPSQASGNVITKVSGSKVVCVYEVVSEDPETLVVYYNYKPVLAYTIKLKL